MELRSKISNNWLLNLRACGAEERIIGSFFIAKTKKSLLDF